MSHVIATCINTSVTILNDCEHSSQPGTGSSEAVLVFLYPADTYMRSRYLHARTDGFLFRLHTHIHTYTHTYFLAGEWTFHTAENPIGNKETKSRAQIVSTVQATNTQPHNTNIKGVSSTSILFSSSVTLFRFCSLFTLHFFQSTHSIHKEFSWE